MSSGSGFVVVVAALCYGLGLGACSLAISTDGLVGSGSGSGDGGGDAQLDAPGSADGGDASGLVDGDLDGGGGTVQVAVGENHSCALAGGRVSCWGSNSDGQLGDGTKTSRLTPVLVQGLPAGTVTKIGAGFNHTCAIVDGKVWCWGTNASGALGPGAASPWSERPVEVTGLPGPASDVQGADDFTCALLDQRVYCWGNNDNGKLGDGTTTSHKAATVVVETNGFLDGVKAFGTQFDHSCAVKTSGATWCWGHHDYGAALGNSSVSDFSPKAVPVQGLPGAAENVGVGGGHVCAVVDGGLWCWGGGADGQLGDGKTAASVAPVRVTGLGDGVTLVATSRGFEGDSTCAVRSGQLWCWGAGTYFRLGDGQTSPRSTPNRVTTLPATVTQLAGGAFHWCAVLATGEVWCWGGGAKGQLGDGAAIDRALPVAVKVL